MANNIGFSVSVDTQQAKSNLNDLLQSSTKWNAAMANKLVMSVDVVFPTMSNVAREFEKYRSKAQSAINRAAKNDAFDFMFYNKYGKEQGEKNYKELFNTLSKNKLDQQSVSNALGQLLELKARLQNGTAVSFGNFGAADVKALDKLIDNLKKADAAFKQLQRTQSKGVTADTTAAVKEKTKELKKQEAAAKRIEDITKQIAIERARNLRNGGQNEKSLHRQIELYHKLEKAAKKANDEQAKDYARNKIIALNKQVNDLNVHYGKQGRLLSGLGSLAARYFSITQIARFVQQVAKTTGYFQQQQVALEGIFHSSAKAREVLNDIMAFAVKSPFKTKELVQYTKQLAAFSIEPDKLFDTTKQLADISAGLGVDMSRIILAYGQVKAASVLRGQELRQFTEAGIPLVDELAKKFTKLNGTVVTTGEVFKLISDRKVSFEMVAEVLADMTKEGGKFYKMQENLTNTLYGQIEKLKDLWTLAMNDIGKSADGFMMKIVKLMQSLLKNAKSVATAVAFAFAAGKVAAFSFELSKAVKKAGSLKKYLMGFASGNLWAAGIGLAFGVIAGLIAKAHDRATKLKRKFDEIEVSFANENRRMIGGLDELTKKIQTSTRGTKEYSDAVATLAQNYSNYISKDIITILEAQGDAASNLAQRFGDIAENVKAAIAEYNKFQEYEQKQKEAENMLIEKINVGAVARGAFGEFDRRSIYNTMGMYDDLKNLLDRDVSTEDVIQEFERSVQKIFEEFVKSDKLDEETFKAISERILSEAFPTMSRINHGGMNELIGYLSQRTFKSAFAGDKSELQRDIREIRDARARKNNTIYAKQNKFFDAVEPGKVIGGTDNIDYGRNLAANYIDALNETLKEKFGDNIPKDLQDAITKAFKIEDGHIIADDYDNNTIANILLLFEAFRDTFKENADMQNWLATVRDIFMGKVNKKTDRTAIVSNLIEGNSKYRNNVDEAVKGLWLRYNPNDNTYTSLREGLKSEYDKLNAELKTYKSKNEIKDQATINSIEEQIKALELLASKEYYNVDLTDKKGGGSGRGGWRRFLSDLFSYIREAREEEKKLVENSAGLTNELAKQIGSQQLEGTPVDVFWESMINKDKSPFKKLIDKMDEYDIESDVFNKDFLQKQLSGIVAEQIKGKGTVNFEKIWDDLIRVIEERITKLEALPEMKSTVDSLKTYLQQVTTEKEKYFGGDKVEALIKEQLNQMKRINAEVEKIRSDREMFDRISESSNYMKAQAIIYGDRDYKTNFAQDVSLERIRKFLGEDVGAGIKERLNDNRTIQDLLNGGRLNVFSLSAITALRKELGEVTLNDMEGITPEEQQAKFETFKGTLGEFDKMLDELTKGLVTDFQRLMSLRDPMTKTMDDIYKAGKAYVDAIAEIKKDEFTYYEEDGIRKPIIEREVADRMRTQAVQTYYNSVAKSLGGNGMQSYIDTLYPDKRELLFRKNITGVTDIGYKLGMWLNDGSLSEKIMNNAIVKSGLRRDQFKSDEEFEAALKNATEAAQKFAAGIELAAAIIQKVDGYIQASAKFANSLIDALEASNDITTDMYGNYAKKNDYSEAREVINTIADFSSGISGSFQSLIKGDIWGAIMGFGSSIAKFFQHIFGIGDAQLQKKQDELISSNKYLIRSLDKLRNKINEVSGIEKWDNLTEQITNLRKQEENQLAILKIELQKKSGDPEKAEEARDAAEQAAQEIRDIIRGIQEDIFGTADELAATLTDPLVDAFRNGANAAREWRNAVRSYISDVLKDVLMTRVIAPRIQKILDSFGIKEGDTDSESIQKLFRDPTKVTELVNALDTEGSVLIDLFNNLPRELRELIGWNNSTSDLSGGIQGITEDTARTLEGLANSILMQNVLQSGYLQQIASSGFAHVQLSWFNNMLQLQRAIESNTSTVSKILNASQLGTQTLKVTIQ